LLFRPGYLARIVLTGLRVDVPAIGTPREPYSWHATPSHIRVGEVIADGAAVKIAREDADRPLVFDVHTAKLTSVSRNQPLSYYVTVHNPLPPGEITARGKFGPWNSDDPGTTQLSGATSFRNADLSVYHGVGGTLSSDNHFGGPLQRVEARGVIDVPDFSVIRSKHAVHVKTAFHAFINGLNGDVHLEHVAAGFRKTTVTAEGNIAGTPGGHGKAAQLDLFVTNGRIQDVLHLFVSETRPPLNGVTSFRAHFSWPPGDSSFLQKIRLTGDFGIAGGQFTKGSTQSDVADLSDRARGEKSEDNPEDPDDIVSNLSGHVDLRRAVATLSDISFEVPGALAKMQGTFNLENHKVDLHGTLKTDAEFSHMISGFKSVLLKPFNVFFKKKHVGAVVPVHLIGTYEHPETGMDIVPKGAPQQSPPAADRSEAYPGNGNGKE
jgi:AsmA-like protein